jgi:hypothetical protein
MYVMPGYESFNGFDGDPVGIKVYQPQDIALIGTNNKMLLTKKLDGTGSKLFQCDANETEWRQNTFYAGGTREGSDNLVAQPFLAIIGALSYFPIQDGSSFLRIARFDNVGYSNSWTSTSGYAFPDQRFEYISDSPNGLTYFYQRGFSNLSSLANSGVSWDTKTTAVGVGDIAAGDYTIAIGGNIRSTGRNLLWDNASLLADQNNNLGFGSVRACGVPSQLPAFAMQENLTFTGAFDQDNGLSAMSVKVLEGESVNTVYRKRGFRRDANDMYAVKANYKDTFSWYARFATNASGTEVDHGVWAFGKGSINSQMGVSKLLDTATLGSIRRIRWFGDSCYFINHSGDGSVSRLHNFETGTYDVPATIETLIYGADSPYLKELNGISIVTENLPSGGSVVCSYRTDEDDAWVELGTSNTVGKQRHSFTKANGNVIGRFQEIQFKIVITGKTAVKNIMVAVTETDDLPF